MTKETQNQERRIDQFFSGPGARADQWRDLVEAAKAWAGGTGDRNGRSVEDRIRLRAYQISQARNGGPEDALADWVQAERELTAAHDANR